MTSVRSAYREAKERLGKVLERRVGSSNIVDLYVQYVFPEDI